MSMNMDLRVSLPNLPASGTTVLQKFCSRIVGALGEKVLSLNVIGSAISPDYTSGVSDINLLIVLDGLDLEDIRPLVPDIKKFWLGKRISPRFISRRNLDEAIRYFPVDFWNMQRQHTVLYGQDILSEISIRRRDLLWQLRHELLGLRMRVKQQYWRTIHSPHFAKGNLLRDLNTVIYLGKVLLHLENIDYEDGSRSLITMLSSRFGLAQDLLGRLMDVKQKRARLQKKDIIPLYEQILTFIRELDRAAERVDA